MMTELIVIRSREILGFYLLTRFSNREKPAPDYLFFETSSTDLLSSFLTIQGLLTRDCMAG